MPLLCALVLLLNLNALRAFFVGDDFEILRKVTRVDGLGDALRITYDGNWGPLSYVQFYLNHRTAGFDPMVYHLTNLAWLALLVVALHGFVRRTLPDEPWAAWAAALLFLTHPANDQAVANLCGRSHVIATAMALVALGLYARLRLGRAGWAGRAALLSGSLLAAFLAGLSKESAMTLPAWIAAFECLFCRRREDSLARTALRAIAIALLFLVAALAVFGAGLLVVGRTSPKIEGESPDLGAFLPSDLAVYALISSVPFPFAWVDLPALQRLQALGWAALLAVVAAGVRCLWLCGSRRAGSRAPALFALGLTIAATTLLPVVYADLQLQRRYVFISNVGTVLMAVAAFQALRPRLPRASRVVPLLLVLAGAAGTVQRNDLYRRAGDVVRSAIETALATPIDRLPLAEGGGPSHVAFVTLPRYYGGDRASGAILMHISDLRAALRLFGTTRPEIAYALRCSHAQDYATRVVAGADSALDLIVSFRSRRAFRAALARDTDGIRRGTLSAELVSSDPDSRVLRYRLTLDPERRADYGELLLYGDGRFTRLRP